MKKTRTIYDIVYDIVNSVTKDPGEQDYWIDIVTKDRLRAIQQLVEAFPQYRNRLFTKVIERFSAIVSQQETEDDKLAVIHLLAIWFQQPDASKLIDTLITKATLNGIAISRLSVETIYQLKSHGEKDFPKNMDELNAKLQSLKIEISEGLKNKVMNLLQVIDNLLVKINTDPEFNLDLSDSRRKSIEHTDSNLTTANLDAATTNENTTTLTNGM